MPKLKSLLSHKDPNDVTAGYIVSNVDRLREPTQQITDFIIKNSNKNNKDRTIVKNPEACLDSFKHSRIDIYQCYFQVAVLT